MFIRSHTYAGSWARRQVVDHYRGNFAIDGAKFQTWAMIIQNNGGTLRHGFFMSTADGMPPLRYADRIGGIDHDSNPGPPNYTYQTTPSVAAGTGFGTAGGGRLNSDNSIFVLDTAEQGQLGDFCWATIEYYSANVARPRMYPAIIAHNINGVTRRRLCLQFWNYGTGAAWNINTTNISSGNLVGVRFMGFVR